MASQQGKRGGGGGGGKKRSAATATSSKDDTTTLAESVLKEAGLVSASVNKHHFVERYPEDDYQPSLAFQQQIQQQHQLQQQQQQQQQLQQQQQQLQQQQHYQQQYLHHQQVAEAQVVSKMPRLDFSSASAVAEVLEKSPELITRIPADLTSTDMMPAFDFSHKGKLNVLVLPEDEQKDKKNNSNEPKTDVCGQIYQVGDDHFLSFREITLKSKFGGAPFTKIELVLEKRYEGKNGKIQRFSIGIDAKYAQLMKQAMNCCVDSYVAHQRQKKAEADARKVTHIVE